ncbi:hypothetical protein DFH28DRAFT_890069 [Melampsora americana]|nr:hypothetical protein DFH28DRAFT_890069 [Melampsora americana]
MAFSNRKKTQQARRAAEAERLRIDNEIVGFIENQIADSEDEQECDEELKDQLFPVFLSHNTVKPAIGKRRNRLGNLKRYKRPICNPNPLKKKLISKPVPKATRQYWQKKAVTAGFMAHWTKPKPKAEAPLTSDFNIEIETQSTNSLNDQDHSSDDQDSAYNDPDDPDDASEHTEDFGEDEHGLDLEYEEWISSSVQKAQATRHAKMDSTDALARQSVNQIEEQWAALDAKIKSATQKYKDEHKKDPKRDIPHLILDKLREFNFFCKELSLVNSKSPTIQASILAAQGSLRRLPSNHMNFSTGIGRAIKIRAQANHLVTMSSIIHSRSGFGLQHPSLLDNAPLWSALRTWSFSRTPGEVSQTLDNSPNNFN